MTSDFFLIGIGAALGAVIACYVCCRMAQRQLEAEREDAQRELKRALNDREYWKAQAARYRASLDGSSGYWPRPLNPK